MSLCDICNTPVEGTKLNADQVRGAVKNGFNPFSSQYADLPRFESWRAMVQQNDTDWNLCADCLRKLRPYLRGGEAVEHLPGIAGSVVLAGHEERVNDVALSPDGTRVLTGSWDTTVRLWDFATGKQLACLRDHKDFVNTVAFAPGGKIAASGAGGDYMIRIWDLERGTVIHRLKGHSFTVFSLQFSRDGSRLLSGSGDCTVRLWDVRTGKQIRRFGGMFGGKHESGVESVSFSAAETQALSVGLDAIVWDVESGKQIQSLKKKPLWNGAFLNGDRQVLVSGPQGFTVFDVSTAAEVETLSDLRADSGKFAVTRTGRLFAGRFGTVTLFDLKSRKVIFKAEGHAKRISAVDVSADGRRGASSSDDWTARTWQLT
jgi:WD40 repeat protein